MKINTINSGIFLFILLKIKYGKNQEFKIIKIVNYFGRYLTFISNYKRV